MFFCLLVVRTLWVLKSVPPPKTAYTLEFLTHILVHTQPPVIQEVLLISGSKFWGGGLPHKLISLVSPKRVVDFGFIGYFLLLG